MFRIQHYIKETKSVSNPTNLMFFDTETKANPDTKTDKLEHHYLWHGYALAYRREGIKRTRIKEVWIDTPKDFWEFLISRLDKTTVLVCYAHNLPFDLTIIDAWLSGDQYGISVDLPILDDPPIIIFCSHERGKVVFVDTFNYWKSSLADIGKMIGAPKMEMPTAKVWNADWKAYCKNDVLIVAQAIDGLIAWLESNKLGSLKYTTPSLAMSVYKTCFMPKETILAHCNERVLRLERDSYHGGLVVPYYIGVIKEPLYKYDVNSLYPSMMLREYPSRLVSEYQSISPNTLLGLMDRFAAVSLVGIRTEKWPYPVYYGGKLVEAIGTYTVPLCGDELRYALEEGHIVKCEHTALYDTHQLFAKYVEYFWKRRKEYQKKGDKVGDLFCKLMLNSLYGKFAQQSTDWLDLTYESLTAAYALQGLDPPTCYESEDALPVWPVGVHYWTPLRYPHQLTIRVLPGSRQMKVITGESSESCPIISSYVTSYARQHMRKLRQVAGERNTYYTDTDSLIVNEKGQRKLELSGQIDATALGMLKLEGVSNHTVIHGPKDYLFGEIPTIKGIRRNAKQIGPNTYEQLQFEGLASVLRRDAEPFITIKTITKTLKRQYDKGTIRPDGWVDYKRLDLM